jgi:hypothetical protein
MSVKVIKRQSIELMMVALLAVVPAAVLFPGAFLAAATTTALHIESRLEVRLEEVLSIGSLDDDALFMWAGVAVDSDGFVYVTDAMDYSLKKFDPSGRLVKRTGRKGQGPGEFLAPRFLAASCSYLFATDQSLTGIQMFDKDLEFVSRIPFNRPIADIAVISENTLAVIPFSLGGSGTIVLLDAQGRVLKEIQYAEPEKKLSIFNVADLEIDPSGDILLAYSFRDRIEKWSPSGQRIWSRQLLDREDVKEKRVAQFTVPSDVMYKTITSDSSGRIYVLSGNLTDHPSRDVFILDQDGGPLATLILPEPSHCIYIDGHDFLYSRANEGVTIKKFRVIFSGPQN